MRLRLLLKLCLSVLLLWPILTYSINNDHVLAQAKSLMLQNNLNTNSTLQTTLPQTDSPVKANKIPKNSQVWNLRNTDITAVINEVSHITGKNFVIDPRVQGKISIVSSTPIPNRALYQVFLSMLQIAGYSAIPSGNIIKIVPSMDARTQFGTQGSEDMMIEVIPVHYVPAEQLVPVLRPLMPQWSTVSAYSPSNMLILSGHANNIHQLAGIIRQVDTSNANGIDIVPLHHAFAMDIVNTLKDLIKSQPGMSNHAQPMIAADDRGNAILLSGNKTDRLRLRLLIARLDHGSPNNNQSNTKVVYLSYLRAEDLVPILAGIAQANFSGIVGTTIGTMTRPDLDSTNPEANLANGPSSGGPSISPFSGLNGQVPNMKNNTPSSANSQNEGSTKPTVQIIAEPNTNSVIINGPPVLIRTLQAVISQLDIKPSQLLVEALVAELNEQDFNSLGIEWGSVSDTSNPNTFRPGFAVLSSRTNIAQFEARIYALAQQHRANILSTPSVVVLDNHQAKIMVGKQVAVQTSSYPNNANASTTASPYSTFDRVNVALHLYVRPQITRDKGIQLQIDQGNNTLDSTNPLNTANNPVFNISAIVTSVHVKSGDIIVLGGLAQNSLANEDISIPIIGDLPGVGKLFQHNITNREKKVLMVFIRPHILRTERDNLQFTETKYGHTRDDQLDFLRTQEVYDDRDKEQVMAAWATKALPRPFCKDCYDK